MPRRMTLAVRPGVAEGYRWPRRPELDEPGRRTRPFERRSAAHFDGELQYSTGVGVHGGALLSGWRGLIIKGWTFLSNINVGSGMPFTPIYPARSQGTRLQRLRPEYVGGNVYGRDPATIPQSRVFCARRPPANSATWAGTL